MHWRSATQRYVELPGPIGLVRECGAWSSNDGCRVEGLDEPLVGADDALRLSNLRTKAGLLGWS